MTRERRRLRTVQRWLELEWPVFVSVRVRVERMPKDYAECLGTYHPPEKRGQLALIRITRESALSEQISTLIHEWTHCRLDPWAEAAERPHGGHTNEFYLEQGRIERALWQAIEGPLKPRS